VPNRIRSGSECGAHTIEDVRVVEQIPVRSAVELYVAMAASPEEPREQRWNHDVADRVDRYQL
jgi:hypothetical protein